MAKKSIVYNIASEGGKPVTGLFLDPSMRSKIRITEVITNPANGYKCRLVDYPLGTDALVYQVIEDWRVVVDLRVNTATFEYMLTPSTQFDYNPSIIYNSIVEVFYEELNENEVESDQTPTPVMSKADFILQYILMSRQAGWHPTRTFEGTSDRTVIPDQGIVEDANALYEQTLARCGI